MIETGIGALWGIGPAKIRAFAKLGVDTVEDLLHHYPRAYENRGNVRALQNCDEKSKCATMLTIAIEPRLHRIKRGMSLLKFRAVEDGSGDTCEITYFNQDYLKDTFHQGATYRFYGRVERQGNRYAMASPAFEEIPAGHEADLPPLLPVYPATQGLSQKQIATAVQLALRMAASDVDAMHDPLPEEVRRKRGLCAYGYALRHIHRPADAEALSAAKKRLVYEELYLFSLGLAMTRSQTKHATAPACLQADVAPLCARLPYALTGAQQRVIEEIRTEMMGNVPMSRMIVGDVGCGKTVCAAAAILFAVQSGYQAALMAPTEILARQHFAELSDLFAALSVSCALLIGATGAAKKREIRAALAAGTLDVVIGTQALLTDGVEFSHPALMVTDEQHRFGVGQRATLSQKNRHAHLLVMSATPIPRSLALGLYGDLDISRIDEMPPGRQVVDTFVVDESYRPRLNAFIQKQAAKGGQVYVVCPAIEEQDEEMSDEATADLLLDDVSLRGAPRVDTHEDVPIKHAITHAKELQEALPDLFVACLHGRMKAAEKDAVMQAFIRGEVQVLVSTTVIEVGVNVPSATLMIVENAERFGLSQLHQLRGRVGRGKDKSYCVLVHGERTGSVAKQRLEVMRTQHDGFEIAKQDLLLRGPGDFLRGNKGEGVRQSGGIRFRLADSCDDADFLELAMQDARALIDADPQLETAPVLRQRVNRLFTPACGTLN